MKLLLAASFVASVAADNDKRLTIVNACDKPMWIAHIIASGVGPDTQDLKIEAGSSATFHTNLNGGALSATRFWPKLGCDETGNNCTVGDSGGPGEGCVKRVDGKPDDYSLCAPPVDSKFEASFTTEGSATKDVLDMSLVDGFSLPFKLETSGGACTRGSTTPFKQMDCSGLSVKECPTEEPLIGKTMSLKAKNPRTQATGGCYSPCMKLTDDKWTSGTPFTTDSKEAGPYCCAGEFNSPGTCNVGPVLKTKYLAMTRKLCPEAYGYAYDDKTATIACDFGTQYKVTYYCPSEEEDLFLF